MTIAYSLGGAPVARPYSSRHNTGEAVDMIISHFAGKTVMDANGREIKIRTFLNIKSIGATYHVYWYGPEDKVHWSVDGE
jgi:hypothetical protein